MRTVREITAEEENFRMESMSGFPDNFLTIRRDSIEPRLFFQYQGIGVFIDIAVLIASIIKNDFGVWLLYVFAGTHVLVALLFGLVYFLFAEE